MSVSFQPYGVKPTTTLFCLWDFPGKNTGVSYPFFLQGSCRDQTHVSCVSCIGREGQYSLSILSVSLESVVMDPSFISDIVNNLCLLSFQHDQRNGTPLQYSCLENPPWMAEPGGLQSMGSLKVGTTEQLHFHFSLSCIGEGNGNPLQCSCLENPRDGGVWWAAVYEVAQSRTRLK